MLKNEEEEEGLPSQTDIVSNEPAVDEENDSVSIRMAFYFVRGPLTNRSRAMT